MNISSFEIQNFTPIFYWQKFASNLLPFANIDLLHSSVYLSQIDAEKIHSTTCMLFYFIVKGKSLFQIIFAIKIIVKSCRYQTSTQTNIVVVEKNGWENVDPPKIKILIRDSPIQQEINCRVNTTLITITHCFKSFAETFHQAPTY